MHRNIFTVSIACLQQLVDIRGTTRRCNINLTGRLSQVDLTPVDPCSARNAPMATVGHEGLTLKARSNLLTPCCGLISNCSMGPHSRCTISNPANQVLLTHSKLEL